MPNNKPNAAARFDGDVPKVPHLIFYTSTGQASAFKPGNVIGIVEDPHNRSPHWKMVIEKVTERSLHFRCACNPGCTVKWVYTGKSSGQHSR